MKKSKLFAITGLSAGAIVLAIVGIDVIMGTHELRYRLANALSPYYWSLMIQAKINQNSGLPKFGSSDPYQTRFNSAKEFENWMNSNATWTRSAKIQFFNLGQCESNFYEYEGGTYSYNCSEGFARISSPMGESVCPVSNVSYKVNSYRNQSWDQSSSGCLTPKQIADSRDTSYLSSIGLLALGGAMGYAGSILARNTVKRNQE